MMFFVDSGGGLYYDVAPFYRYHQIKFGVAEEVMKKHGIAVVGCGMLGQAVHLPNIVKNPRLELIATCDIAEEYAKEAMEKFGAKRCETDWRKIVEAEDIDMALLATHVNLRGEFIVPMLEKGKPVYTEKPLSPSTEDMNSCVRAVRKTGVPVCVGHNRRSSAAVLEMKRLLDKARTATEVATPAIERQKKRRIPEEALTQILFRIADDIRSWKDWIFWDEQGIMFGEMVHFIDLALWFNPSPPVRVFVEGSNRGNFTQIIRFQDGSITTIQHSMVGNLGYPKEFCEATLNNVTIAMDQHFELRQCGLLDEPMFQTFPFAQPTFAEGEGMTAYIKSLEAELKRAAKAGEKPGLIGVSKGHYEQLDRFLDHIEGKGENPCDMESAVAVNRIAIKMLESAALGLPVAVSPQDWHIPES